MLKIGETAYIVSVRRRREDSDGSTEDPCFDNPQSQGGEDNVALLLDSKNLHGYWDRIPNVEFLCRDDSCKNITFRITKLLWV